MASRRLKNHPRLYIGRREIARLRENPAADFLKSARRLVSRQAKKYLDSATYQWPADRHNGHLIRARIMQGRVLTLIARYLDTGDSRFRDAAVRHIRKMGRWKYWSWITWRVRDSRPDAIFDLSYGENSATLALAYDLLFDVLGDDEHREFIDIARRRAIAPFLANTEKGNRDWWFGKKDSNWNTVCAGGAGMLALAMYEDIPEAREALRRAEVSVRPFMKHLEQTEGGWCEGVGYWNYGMRYAFRYLLSHERATGRPHPLVEQAATRKTLFFPLHFAPGGVACGFGDSNHFWPLPFHYQAAERLGAPEVAASLDRVLEKTVLAADSSWPNAAEMLFLHTRGARKAVRRARPFLKLYRGLDWGVIADGANDPRIYLSVRGGTTEVPHGHHDLLSYHCVVDGEPLVDNIGITEYLDTTFSPRRYDVFETTPASKNTILINGVGVAANSSVKTDLVKVGSVRGIRMEAAKAMGTMRDGPAALFCGRLFLLLGGSAALIVDKVTLPHTGRVESRMHTRAKAALGRAGAKISGRRARLRVAYASSVPSALHGAAAALTTPGEAPTVLRWCTDGLVEDVTMATLLVAGASRAKVSVTERKGLLTVRSEYGKRKSTVTVTGKLRPPRTATR